MHVLSSFQRTGSLGGYFRLAEPCVRRHQANSPRMPNQSNPVNTFFSVSPRRSHPPEIQPSPQPSCAALLRTLAASPLGLGPRRLAGLGCRPPGALEKLAAGAASLTRHPGGEAAQCGDAGAPGKTFEISGKCPRCQPQNGHPLARLVMLLGTALLSSLLPALEPGARVSRPASKSGVTDYALASEVSTQKIARGDPLAPLQLMVRRRSAGPGRSHLACTRTISLFPA